MAHLRVAGIRMNDNVAPEHVEVERAKHQANFAQAGGQDELDRCVQERTQEWIHCVLGATSLAQAQTCD